HRKSYWQIRAFSSPWQKNPIRDFVSYRRVKRVRTFVFDLAIHDNVLDWVGIDRIIAERDFIGESVCKRHMVFIHYEIANQSPRLSDVELWRETGLRAEFIGEEAIRGNGCL